MRIVAWLLGLVAVAFLVVLAVAGANGATAILLTVVAIVVMIVLGNMLGGRTTPNREPAGHRDEPPPGDGDGPRQP